MRKYEISIPGGKTVLMDAVLAGDIDEVRSLLRDGANLSEKGVDGKTALMYAVPYPDIVKLLLATGKALPGAKDSMGNTAFLIAVSMGYNDSASAIMATGKAKPCAYNNSGANALERAIGMENREMIKKILRVCNPGLKNNDGETALMAAVGYGVPDIVEMILETGNAKPCARNNNGVMALFMNEEHVDEITDMLIEVCPSVRQSDVDAYLSTYADDSDIDFLDRIEDIYNVAPAAFSYEDHEDMDHPGTYGGYY